MARAPILAEREHQIMEILWELGEATSEEIRAGLPADPPLREVTVRTMLRRMGGKEQVAHRVEGRTFVYRPLLEADQERSRAFRYVLDRFFGGSVGELMMHLVESDGLTKQEAEDLREKIEQLDTT